MATDVILGEGGGALALARQGGHHLAVGGFVPGFQAEMAQCILAHRIVIVGGFAGTYQRLQPFDHLDVQVFLLHTPPLLEPAAVIHRKAG
jgi:hypothetical protein